MEIRDCKSAALINIRALRRALDDMERHLAGGDEPHVWITAAAQDSFNALHQYAMWRELHRAEVAACTAR